jgi:hypothetical protein
MPSQTSIRYLEMRTDHDGEPLYFIIPSGDRRHPPKFIQPDDIPDPQNGPGWFECERVRRGPWLGWRALRRVETPS